MDKVINPVRTYIFLFSIKLFLNSKQTKEAEKKADKEDDIFYLCCKINQNDSIKLRGAVWSQKDNNDNDVVM